MYYYIDVEQAKLGRVLLLKKSPTRLNNIDSLFGEGVAVELIADSLPFAVVYDEKNKSVRAATAQERQARALKYLYAGMSLLGKVWTKNDFNMDTFVKRAGDSMTGTLNLTGNVPLTIPYNKGISIYTGNGSACKVGRTSGQEIILAEGISKSIIGSPLQVNGNLNVTGVVSATGDVVGMSDRRIKKDINRIEDPWKYVEGLNGYLYKLKSDNTKHIGLIAQEVEEVLPEAVYIDKKTGLKAIAYGNMGGLWLELFKDIDKRLKKLEGGK